MATTKIYIVYYSMYGHVQKLAHEIKKGADSVEGVEAALWQVPETLSEDILLKLGAPPKSDVPVIEANQLPDADGFVFGFPTRFGMMAAQFKAFFDSTGSLWQAQKLAGKPAGIFYSTASQGGGQETTPLSIFFSLACVLAQYGRDAVLKYWFDRSVISVRSVFLNNYHEIRPSRFSLLLSDLFITNLTKLLVDRLNAFPSSGFPNAFLFLLPFLSTNSCQNPSIHCLNRRITKHPAMSIFPSSSFLRYSYRTLLFYWKPPLYKAF